MSAFEAAAVSNPMPVAPFSVADAARRTWPHLIELMLDAVCLVEPEELRIVAANAAAGRLYGRGSAGELVGCAMPELAATPEDECFWREVGQGLADEIQSASFVAQRGGEAVPVLRRVSRVEPAPGTALYVVALRDRSAEAAAEHSAERVQAELRATLESVGEGVLVTDRAGRIGRMNRRFAQIWSLPETMLLQRDDDDAIFAWMQGQVAFPIDYQQRLGELAADAMASATDLIELRSGARLERATAPHCSRGKPLGLVFTYRPVG